MSTHVLLFPTRPPGGVGDNADQNVDGDATYFGDTFPLDPTETRDTDGDGVGDNADADMDTDGDMVDDGVDAFPNGAQSESLIR